MSDPTIQGRIDELLRQSLTAGQVDVTKVARVAHELRDSFPKRGADLILQLVLYEFTVKDEPLMHAADFVLIELAPGLMRRHETVTSIAPYFSVQDRSIRIRLRELMDHYCCNGGPKVDYGRLFALIRRKNGKVADGLVEYMYERAPGKALLGYMTYSGASDRKAILLAERAISDTVWKHQYGILKPTQVETAALEQLHTLSRHKAWWARLYVAEILRQVPGFRTEALIERLRTDKHPFVRKTIAEIEKPSKQGTGGTGSGRE